MPVFAGWTALAPLDFRKLGGEDTRNLRDSESDLRPKWPVRGIRAYAVQYEQQLKLWVRFRRRKVRKLVRRGPITDADSVARDPNGALGALHC